MKEVRHLSSRLFFTRKFFITCFIMVPSLSLQGRQIVTGMCGGYCGVCRPYRTLRVAL
jgi:hypothetical protein